MWIANMWYSCPFAETWIPFSDSFPPGLLKCVVLLKYLATPLHVCTQFTSEFVFFSFSFVFSLILVAIVFQSIGTSYLANVLKKATSRGFFKRLCKHVA
jgi:hypothetical protein